MSDRLTLALPIDLVRTFDHTVTQTQLANNTFQGTPDDLDMLASLVEDAEDEFRTVTDAEMRLSRAGTPGDMTTFDQVTYSVPGHENFKRNWSRVGGDYLIQEVTKDVAHNRILPFDPVEGDEAYIYRGVSRGSAGQWEDVTDRQGELWDIVDHRNGTLTFHPRELDRSMLAGTGGLGVSSSRLSELRFAISYRYGAAGGARSSSGSTDLGAAITQAESTPFTVAVGDASRIPTTGGGSVVLLLGSEYVRAEVDAVTDEITVVERAVRGTDAEAHASGDRVQYTPPAIRKAVAARAGMGLIQSGRYSAWLPDSDDAISKGDMLDRMQETWDDTVGALG